MIGYLAGSVVSVRGGKLIINVNGVGYSVQCSRSDTDAIQADSEQQLFIYEHIQEKAHDLYGFKLEAGQELFELLLSINGVGPKAALSILDLGPLDSIKSAIASSNSAYVAGANGVGKKTAERVVVELKDKLGEEVMLKGAHVINAKQDEALEALIALGYNQQQAVEALSKVSEGATEDRVRAALKELSS